MPRLLALRFTAASNGSGKRMLIRADFFSNSNWTGRRPDRSYWVRSELATKASAWRSFLRTGSFLSFFFRIVPDLLGMHIAGANGTDVLLAFPFPNGENQKNVPARWRFSDSLEPALRRGTSGLDHN